MIKKILAVLSLVVVIVAVIYSVLTKDKKESEKVAEQVAKTPKTAIEDVVFKYEKNSLTTDCNQDSKMLCAVDFATKCTINPDFDGCKESRLPKFIFMNDENLKRPTEISFKVHKIKPISADLVEIHTNSTCNGNWFGLCQGRVIYVVVPDGESWRVKDIYAIEDKNL